jgi:hypothetical protein
MGATSAKPSCITRDHLVGCDPKTILDHYFCSRCAGLAKLPMICSTCQRLTCKSCNDNVTTKCACGAYLIGRSENGPAEAFIDDLITKCMNAGCGNVCRVGELDAHMEV